MFDPSARFVASDGIYLLSHSVGRPPTTAEYHLGSAFYAPWHKGEGEPWRQWLQLVEDFRAALAGLFSSEPAYFCPQVNLSSALSKVIQSLPAPTNRSEILLNQDDFPSLGFVIQQAGSYGYRAKFLPAGADVTAAEVWREHLTDTVALVLITHVQSNTGCQLPVGEIAAIAMEREVLSIVDVAQSAGVIPIDYTHWNADFVIGSCVKWLCGGPGAGHLWVHPRTLERCQPADVGWFSHENPFEFDIHDFRYHPDALRFWGGTPSVMPFVQAAHSIEVIKTIGVEAIRKHNLALSQRLVDAVDPDWVKSPLDPAQRGGTVVLDPGARVDAVCEALDAERVRYDRRATGIRMSPHIYNHHSDIETVITCFSSAL